jgi:uncharacterized protein involved in type VI secretion and phage assembly
MGRTYKKRPQPPPDQPAENNRRRIGTVEHDERGRASLRWRDAPAADDRTVLKILGTPLTIKSDESYDPYARGKDQPKAARPKTPRTDLRKLSEHIKKMRELEERKRNEQDEE